MSEQQTPTAISHIDEAEQLLNAVTLDTPTERMNFAVVHAQLAQARALDAIAYELKWRNDRQAQDDMQNGKPSPPDHSHAGGRDKP